MSAWIVSKAHIDALIETGLRLGLPSQNRGADPLSWYHTDDRHYLNLADADAVGAMLWAENHRSVNHRYEEETETPAYEFKRFRALTLAEAASAIDCYEYQTNEHPDWEKSEAFAFCDALRRKLLRSVPGWDAAPWGLDEEHRALRQARLIG